MLLLSFSCIVSDEKSTAILIFVSLYVMSYFSKIFLLSLILSNFHAVFFMFLGIGVYWAFSCLWIYSFAQISKGFDHRLLKYFFCLSSFFKNSKYTCIRSPEVVPWLSNTFLFQNPLVLSVFHYYLFKLTNLFLCND